MPQQSLQTHGRIMRQAGRILPALALLLLPVWVAALQPPQRIREMPRQAAVAGISLDQAIAVVEARYKARVVRGVADDFRGRRVYVLRLLSEEGRVWTVRVDAATGAVM